MNDLQDQILTMIQTRLPVEPRPFAAVAARLNCDEDKIISLINQLKKTGIIRRIGAVFNAAHLGYRSTLVAACVPAEKLDRFVRQVNSLPGVSHNYGRDHTFNVWFTLTMPDKQGITDTIEHLQAEYNINVINLPAEKLFKLNVNFNLTDRDEKGNIPAQEPRNTIVNHSPPVSVPFFSDCQFALIRLLQRDLPVTSEPFSVIASDINSDVSAVLRQINDWKQTGLIRRFGAMVRHQRIGFAANAMIVFKVESDAIDRAGNFLSSYPQVSHCYQRASQPSWPYNLYAMTHCRTETKLRELFDEMVQKLQPIAYDILTTTIEYKKQSVRYFNEQNDI